MLALWEDQGRKSASYGPLRFGGGWQEDLGGGQCLKQARGEEVTETFDVKEGMGRITGYEALDSTLELWSGLAFVWECCRCIQGAW